MFSARLRRRVTTLLLSFLILPLFALGTGAATAVSTTSSSKRPTPLLTYTTVKPTSSVARGSGSMLATEPALNGTIGVASVNIHDKQPVMQQWADLALLAGDDSVDVIGLQEAHRLEGVLPRLGDDWGWWMSGHNGSRQECAIAYRRSTFELLNAELSLMHPSLGSLTRRPGRLDRKFPTRFAIKAVLRYLPTGDELTLLNTHVNQFVEAFPLRRPGRAFGNRNAAMAAQHLRRLTELMAGADTRYVVLTGDLNWDYVAHRVVPRGSLLRPSIATVATASYDALGTQNLRPSHPQSHRFVDYVMVRNDSPIGFVAHRTVGGLGTDHRPLVATLALN